jgi:indole-3-glycerol phosphate synthase
VANANILDEILTHKREVEVPARKRARALVQLRAQAEDAPPAPHDFAAALRRADGTVALIAEVKRASPSRGVFVPGAFDPVAIATLYQQHGAAAVSVLTDEPYFKGSLDYLRAISAAIGIPTLRKDFIVDAYQLYEARLAGASAALLIVAALGDAELADLHACALALGLTALVEVHDEAECERALRIGARVIGVNNRSLRTFRTDLATTALCAKALGAHVGAGIRLVSESGIFTQEHVRLVADMGADAILVGESIITADDRESQIRVLSHVTKRNQSCEQ